MLLLSQNCLNANPNLILGSLLLSEPLDQVEVFSTTNSWSDQLFVVLKTSGNARTLLYIGLLSNLFVTNTIDWSSLPKNSISSTFSSVSDNPKRLWKTVNNLLHRKSFSPLPTSTPGSSLADSFANFFRDKISKLRISLTAILLLHPHTYPPLQLNLPVFLLSGLHLSRKYLRFFSTVLASSVTLIWSSPGFWKYVLLSLLIPLPTLSTCLSPQVSFILVSKNLLSRLFSRNLL